MLSFALLVYFLNKVLVAPLSAFIEKREATISDDLAEASENRLESESLVKEQRSILKQAHQEAKKIRDNAEQVAVSERDAILEAAELKAKEKLESANQEIASNFDQAKKILTSQIGSMAIDLTGKLIQKNLDADSQETVVQQFMEPPTSS